MKIKFSKNLEHQDKAVKSIVEIFDTGKNLFSGNHEFTLSGGQTVFNDLELDDRRILENILRIQKENNFSKNDLTLELESYDFSVEMETGTGKTYVYIKTILELAKKYGLKKFIILVPSIAIREGVKKSLSDMKKHFVEDLDLPHYNSFAFDSGKLNAVRRFVDSSDVTIMVTTIQSFNKDTNRMRRSLDQFQGDVPIEKIAETRPIIIMDEPQNMGTELAKSAIGELNPLFKLRYSATHKEPINVVYRLSPVDAYKKGLVKKIDVIGVKEQDAGEFVFRINKFIVEKGSQPKAKVVLETKMADGEFEYKEMILKKYDNLFRKSRRNEKYRDLEISDIDVRNEEIELSNGEIFKLADGKNKEEIFRTQIQETIKTHFEKQERLKDVKVLSLFFIDKVDNYIYEDSLIRKIFEEEFDKFKKENAFFKNKKAQVVHSGYFTKKNQKGEFMDTGGNTKKDKDTFDLIMRDKERLLSFEEDVCFIFSHSALREGWDNPNIFQICTLQETKSEMDKRQKIGRGLRLPVNKYGERIQDSNVNVLTVIANESYDEYVRGLQTEYTKSGQKIEGVENRRRKVKNKVRKDVLESREFKELWKRISKKTKFVVDFNSDELVESVVERFKNKDVSNLVVMVEKVYVDFENDGKLKTVYKDSYAGEKIKGEIKIGNIINRIAKDTNLTKKTVFKILEKLGKENLGSIFDNPEEFLRSLIVVINSCLNEIVVNNGLKYIETGDFYEAKILFEEYFVNKQNSIDTAKTVFEKTEIDSEGEKRFAKNIDRHKDGVKVFTKLPMRFKIMTPLGGYSPDWAIFIEKDEKGQLYLVRETKFAEGKSREEILNNLRPSEQIKIKCAKKHFEVLGVDFRESTQGDLSDLVG